MSWIKRVAVLCCAVLCATSAVAGSVFGPWGYPGVATLPPSTDVFEIVQDISLARTTNVEAIGVYAYSPSRTYSLADVDQSPLRLKIGKWNPGTGQMVTIVDRWLASWGGSDLSYDAASGLWVVPVNSTWGTDRLTYSVTGYDYQVPYGSTAFGGSVIDMSSPGPGYTVHYQKLNRIVGGATNLASYGTYGGTTYTVGQLMGVIFEGSTPVAGSPVATKDAASVDSPASIALIGFGLIGLGLTRRFKS